MSSSISKFIDDESGATAIEYGIIAALIVSFLIVSLTVMKSNLNTAYSKVAQNLS